MIEGHCHCGAIRWRIADRPQYLVSCNCGICHRYGALWGHGTEASVTIMSADDSEKIYAYGDKMISFHRCRACGCVTHYSSRPGGKPDDRVSVNMRMAGPDLVAGFRIRAFDGADSWKFVT